MIKLDYYDASVIYYSYNGLLIKGTWQSKDIFNFYFPIFKNITLSTYIIKKYELLLFGEKVKDVVDTKVREEIEEVLEEKMKDNLNKEMLIEMLFSNKLELA